MLCFFVACCLIGAPPAADDRPAPPLVADTDRDIDAFYARYRQAETPRQRANAVLDLCQIHNQIWSDPRYASIQKLRGMRNKVVFQLKTAQKDFRKAYGLRDGNRRGEPPIDEGATSQQAGLRQTQAPDLATAWSHSLLLGLQFAPGPSQVPIHAGSFAGDDHGPELVALIEATIHPEHWDTNGGPGHIHYYRPVMALIVRAGSVEQEEVSGLLQGLRGAGQ